MLLFHLAKIGFNQQKIEQPASTEPRCLFNVLYFLAIVMLIVQLCFYTSDISAGGGFSKEQVMTAGLGVQKNVDRLRVVEYE
ncbi:hypothetical protein PsorP6_011539 [Peronosclerospora sorghi]|uniref:Uncharacterized protein n=1 Tax=Peronosclerospora sorghi TaxID=230839 RepID=A0ACC0WJY0_9STRA|nr:hypothetical protein PsorP6_011539 [Peronosclerospora sorghi]